MIVRITRARIRPHSEGHVFAVLRAATDGVPRPPGLEAMHIGRRMDNGGNELVSISVWTDMDALIATFGNDFAEPTFMPALDAYLLEASIELFETVVDSFEDLADVG